MNKTEKKKSELLDAHKIEEEALESVSGGKGVFENESEDSKTPIRKTPIRDAKSHKSRKLIQR